MMRHPVMWRLFSVAAIVAILAGYGCGGGSGGVGRQVMDPMRPDLMQPEMMKPEPELTHAERVSQIFSNADLYLPSMTALAHKVGGGSRTASLFAQRSPTAFPSNPALDLGEGEVSINRIFDTIEYDGITTGYDIYGPGFEASVTAIGGWMDYNYFESKHISSLHADGQRSDISVAYSFGAQTGRNPTQVQGGATWRGMATGVDTYITTGFVEFVEAEDFHGDATLTVDVSRMTIDARFHNFAKSEYDDARLIPDIYFRDMSIVNGKFDNDDVVTLPNHISMIDGAFYGPNHEEVGGAFTVTPMGDMNGRLVTGAFGAKRQ